MRFLKQTTILLKNKKINNNYFNNNFLYNIDSFCWNYSIDTWKLLNIERVLIDLKDIVFINYAFKKQSKNYSFLTYLKNLYILFFISKTNINSYNYLNFYKLNNKIINEKKLINLYSLNNLNINNIFLFNFLWKDFFFINIYKNIFNLKYKKTFFILLLNFRLFFKNVYDFFLFNNLFLLKNKLLNKKFIKNTNIYNFKYIFKKTKLTIKLIKKNKYNIDKIKNFFYINKPIVFNNIKSENTFSLLRKQKIYTKNKYSRSRQYCKNIVLFGLLLNIILMFGLNSAYYAILINLSYFIHIFYFILLFLSLYLINKYKLFNFKNY